MLNKWTRAKIFVSSVLSAFLRWLITTPHNMLRALSPSGMKSGFTYLCVLLYSKYNCLYLESYWLILFIQLRFTLSFVNSWVCINLNRPSQSLLKHIFRVQEEYSFSSLNYHLPPSQLETGRLDQPQNLNDNF